MQGRTNERTLSISDEKSLAAPKAYHKQKPKMGDEIKEGQIDRKREKEEEGRERAGNRPDAVQFTSRLRNWLSHGLVCTFKDIYYRPTSKVTTVWSKLG